MKLSLDQNMMTSINQSKQKRENIDPDENILLKEYMQSFLKWIYVQNNDFCNTLNNEEISNYFMKQLNHPTWMKLLIEKNKFKMMVAIDNYINKYKSNAYMFKELIQIEPIILADYLPTYNDKKHVNATPKQLYFLKSILKTQNKHVENLNDLSMDEASFLIQLLKSDEGDARYA